MLHQRGEANQHLLPSSIQAITGESNYAGDNVHNKHLYSFS